MVALLGGLLLILLFGGFWILGLIRVIMGRIRMVGGSCSRGMYGPLKTNSVITVEPGIYIPAKVTHKKIEE